VDKPNLALDHLSPPMQNAVQQLHRWEQRRRWLQVALLWLCLFPLCLWLLRYHVGLLRDYFTWSAIRYGLAFNPIPATGLVLTFCLTVSSLLSHWFYQTYGLSSTEVRRLEKRAARIQAKGQGHPLWKTLWG